MVWCLFVHKNHRSQVVLWLYLPNENFIYFFYKWTLQESNIQKYLNIYILNHVLYNESIIGLLGLPIINSILIIYSSLHFYIITNLTFSRFPHHAMTTCKKFNTFSEFEWKWYHSVKWNYIRPIRWIQRVNNSARGRRDMILAEITSTSASTSSWQGERLKTIISRC